MHFYNTLRNQNACGRTVTRACCNNPTVQFNQYCTIVLYISDIHAWFLQSASILRKFALLPFYLLQHLILLLKHCL